MADLHIIGGSKLMGKITPAGNKNAIMPIIPATLLTTQKVTLTNVPDLTDVQEAVDIMISLGSKINWDKDRCTMELLNDDINLDGFKGKFPMGARGVILFLAPMISRLKKLEADAQIKGCSLGIREVDTHLDVLKDLGANVKYDSDSKLEVTIEERFKAANIWREYASVTTTENFIMAAVLAKGKSSINNAACEPHVQDLCNFLNSMGAKITGIGTNILEIEGVDSLGGTTHAIISDHHEITSFLALGAMTGGRVEVENAIPEHFPLIVQQFDKLGVEIKYNGDTAIVEGQQSFKVKSPYTTNFIPKIEAAPWPYFPTDLHPLLMALATQTDGQVLFWNKVYEGANFWIPELIKFGVKALICDPHRVLIWGGLPLRAATVDAPKIIRATVALLMTALVTPGESVVKSADAIKRAHPGFAEKLESLGAKVKWVE
ncbi:UDP-N-acetylglucosamine 1-carboxyvinyltransferase [Candidatus Dojkabacteria bacterium]|nr:UDP-N-acetylglucosamine 1-carboxyvinyltransferase [Candidatus Dojkabacteria bacterium]